MLEHYILIPSHRPIESLSIDTNTYYGIFTLYSLIARTKLLDWEVYWVQKKNTFLSQWLWRIRWIVRDLKIVSEEIKKKVALPASHQALRGGPASLQEAYSLSKCWHEAKSEATRLLLYRDCGGEWSEELCSAAEMYLAKEVSNMQHLLLRAPTSPTQPEIIMIF